VISHAHPHVVRRAHARGCMKFGPALEPTAVQAKPSLWTPHGFVRGACLRASRIIIGRVLTGPKLPESWYRMDDAEKLRG
jgi:hypothetical protein